MIVAEPRMDFNPNSKQSCSARLSPKKEKNPIVKHEEYSLTCETARASAETLSLTSDQNLEVDIAESDDEIDPKLNKAEDPDATEYSSSFADTTSDADMCNGITEAEVESHFFDDLGPAYDSFGSIFHFRKKKLTSHWRSFIRPLMWRCKWTELRINEIESRALEYSRQLEGYDQTKPGTVDPSMSETCGIKSIPFSNPCYRKSAAKRRKRKRVEDTNDIASYLAHHNLFSYIEKKRLSSDGIALADDFGAKDQHVDLKNRMDFSDEQSLLDYRDGDGILEQVLWKIELAHSQVNKLKSQLDVLMSKNAARFSSSENLSLLAASSAPSPTISAGTGDVMSVGAIYNSEHIPEYVLEDLVFSESAISSYREVFHVPDIIESTVGLLSAADVTFHESQIGDSCENILDNILIHNGVAEEMEPTFMETSPQPPLEQVNGTVKREEVVETSMPLQILQQTAPHEKSVLRSCLANEILVPRNKRTRGERKASSWCKQHPNDPESQ
ncbi:PREDICTED: uncharacterized protein LOC104804014 [Tarenaya hassleriana]|uniref:uncharacterized protein LOC104804014 n=1 Tax=Tarenaya hassleriana TaxID=28532 RepID=UPI00053C7A2A|nr:PREDICTED: uncharacterized protein LOC104804014 [Tarenaya hassleriana]XP_010526470.1 PREDICTED: uncharacterized protein LOC104804014 [Tarenaya hassleriana]